MSKELEELVKTMRMKEETHIDDYGDEFIFVDTLLEQALSPKPITAQEIVSHINNNDKLREKYFKDWKFHKYIDYGVNEKMNWNELMEYMAFDLFDKHFMQEEE